MRSSHAGLNITDYSLIKRYNIYDTKEGSSLVSSSELIQENNQQKHKSNIRLLSDKQINSSECFNELALLSKRKARTLLRIGNNTLNSLINNGEIKVIKINNKDKIPFVSLQEYVLKMYSKNEYEVESSEYYSEEEYVGWANKIVQENLKGGS